jgi:hypothetical protein
LHRQRADWVFLCLESLETREARQTRCFLKNVLSSPAIKPDGHFGSLEGSVRSIGRFHHTTAAARSDQSPQRDLPEASCWHGDEYQGGEEVKLRLLLRLLPISIHGIRHIEPPSEYAYNDCPAGHNDPAPEPCHFHLSTPCDF